MTAHIVNDRNEYLAHTVSACAPRYDGDDDSFVSVAVWTRNPDEARAYGSARSARRALGNMWKRWVQNMGRADVLT